MDSSRTTRRQFLRAASGGALAAGLPGSACPDALGDQSTAGDIPRRPLGKTGEKVSIICLGGYHIGVPKDEAEALRIIDAALDAGINFLDNAWKYNAGRSEERMGKALQGAKRDRAFLMTKSNIRSKKGMLEQLEQSLRRLKTDYLDLWQIHEVDRGDPNRIFGPGGAIEAVVQAKKQGKIRYIGFTGHANPAAHQEMLDNGFDFATVQMPLNPLDHHHLSFEKRILPKAIKRKMGVIAMKTLAFGKLPQSGVATSEECWRYVLSMPVSTVCTGCQSMTDLNRAARFARAFTPMSEKERSALLERTKKLALGGKFEDYKSACAGRRSLDGYHDRYC
jgi:uncharacterized protein